MAIGKNKRLTKGKKGQKGKKIIDPMSRKEWFDFKAPTPFDGKSFGKTCINKTAGTKISTDRIKGRVVEVSLADLKTNSEQQAWRKVRLMIEDVEGKYCRTSFYGLDMTRDKLCSYIRKWQTLIESTAEVKTKDGYIMRVFTIGFTKKVEGQLAKTSYAQAQQIKRIRQKMATVVQNEARSKNLTDFVKTLITDTLGQEVVKECKYIYPLSNVQIRKVKMLKKPKVDATKLGELYKNDTVVERTANNVDGAEDQEAKNLLQQ